MQLLENATEYLSPNTSDKTKLNQFDWNAKTVLSNQKLIVPNTPATKHSTTKFDLKLYPTDLK